MERDEMIATLVLHGWEPGEWVEWGRPLSGIWHPAAGARLDTCSTGKKFYCTVTFGADKPIHADPPFCWADIHENQLTVLLARAMEIHHEQT